MTVAAALHRLLTGSASRRSMQKRLWSVALVVAAAALVASVAWLQGQHSELRQAEAMALGEPRPSALENENSPTSTDFAVRLAADPTLVPWARDVQRTAAQLGVSVVTVSNTVVAPQADRLGRHDIQLLLRGPYPQIKLLLKESLDRHSSTSVVRLNMRSVSGVSDVEASVTLVRWGAPVSAEQSTTSRSAAR